MNLKLKHFAAMLLIGDGVMALIRPRDDAAAWTHGPRVWREAMQTLQKSPTATRMVAAAQVAGCIWWLLREEGSEAQRLRLVA